MQCSLSVEDWSRGLTRAPSRPKELVIVPAAPCPCPTRNTDSSGATDGPGHDDATARHRVMHALIVDDDGFIREVARLSLELTGGWAVSLAESGTDGIDQARTLAPDVILLDVMM